VNLGKTVKKEDIQYYISVNNLWLAILLLVFPLWKEDSSNSFCRNIVSKKWGGAAPGMLKYT
jgi:hypothetical protein